jgi:hypothetical protein
MLQKLLDMLTLVLIFSSCSNIQKEESKIMDKKEPIISGHSERIPLKVEIKKNIEHIGASNSKDTIIEGFVPEMKANSIELLNPKSIEKLNKSFTLIESEESFPYVIFLSNTGTEALKLIFHYGGVKNSFSEIEMSQNKHREEGLVLNEEKFVTGRGIQLGMTRKEVESILGKPNIYSNNKIRYRIVDLDLSNSAFLKRYNYPSYYIEAQFFQEKLVKYKFGFDYP